MNLKFPHSLSLDFYGKTVSLQTGLLAMQADSSVIATIGETSIMANVVIDKKVTDLDYFPLQVIFEERMYASGKIKGSRFQKREGRPTDNAILTGRLVDRSLRSLFNQDLKNSIQIIITVLSLDEINQPDTVAVLAASVACRLAGIDESLFAGPVSCIRVGLLKDEYTINPSYDDLLTSTLDLAVSTNKAGICMLEAGMNMATEEQLINGIEKGNRAGEELNTFQQSFIALVNKTTPTKTPTLKIDPVPESILALFESEKDTIKDLVFNHNYTSEKNESLDAYLKAKLSTLIDDPNKKYYSPAFYSIVKDIIQTRILEEGIRPDKRGLDDIRTISSFIDILPRVHGSALFNRGQTQVMNVLTLGTMRDALLQDDMEDFEESTKRYLHHYNFPSYSVGETGRYGAPSRREIGHGNLAEKALVPVIPSEADFPYTIRLVSECLGSNGSTSMASTCASTLALLAGGVPIKEPIAGIAMGVVVDKKDTSKFAVLTDIQGMEDHFGHMDFKLTGGKGGLTALQLDNKLAGIELDVLKVAIKQARKGIDFILAKMNEVIDKPKSDISKYAPFVVSLSVPFDRIGDVIGPSGKMIKSIIAKTNTEIDIEDDGKTFIYGKSRADIDAAKDIIMGMIKEYTVGEILSFIPEKQEKFGYIGKIGGTQVSTLLHNSQIPKEISYNDIKMGVPIDVKIESFNDRKQMNITLRYGQYDPANYKTPTPAPTTPKPSTDLPPTVKLDVE
jgi:polyribonucleotide nucleotidyltransferase